MAGIGDMLREAREKKSLSIDQAQKQTHIHSTVIKALEEGRCDDVLNPTYVKSFLKKYADYLGLDQRKVLDEYRALHPAAQRQERSALKPASTPGPESAPGLPGIMPAIKRIAVAAACVALVVFIGGRIITHFNKPKFVKQSVVLKNAPAAKASKAAKKKSSAKKPATQAAIPKSVPLKLLLKVNHDVLVKLKVDSNLLFGKVLPKGMAEEFTAEKAINIFVAKGEYIELVLNGKSLGSPGKGVLDNVEITRSGVRVK